MGLFLFCFFELYLWFYFYYLLALLWVWVYMSSHVIAVDTDVYSAFAVVFNILCLEVAYDSMRLFHWYLHYIYDLILYLCIMCYTVCYLTGIFYAVVKQISMLFIDNKISVFCNRQTDRQRQFDWLNFISQRWRC